MTTVRHRTSVVCIFDERLLTFFAIDPTSRQEYLFLPGGMIEPGETPVVCAERETFEETGYRVRVDASSEIETHYDFNWDGNLAHCHTYFYRAELAQDFAPPIVVKDADYNHGVVWLPVSEISEKFNYHPLILSSVLALASDNLASLR